MPLYFETCGKMFELQGTLYFLLKLKNFTNIDLTKCGEYQLRFKLKTPFNQSVSESCPNTIDTNSSQDITIISSTININFQNEVVEINEVFLHKIIFLVDSSKAFDTLKQIDLELTVELFYHNPRTSTVKLNKLDTEIKFEDKLKKCRDFKFCSSRKIICHYDLLNGLHYARPIIFGHRHLASINISTQANLISLREPTYKVYKKIKQQNKMKAYSSQSSAQIPDGLLSFDLLSSLDTNEKIAVTVGSGGHENTENNRHNPNSCYPFLPPTLQAILLRNGMVSKNVKACKYVVNPDGFHGYRSAVERFVQIFYIQILSHFSLKCTLLKYFLYANFPGFRPDDEPYPHKEIHLDFSRTLKEALLGFPSRILAFTATDHKHNYVTEFVSYSIRLLDLISRENEEIWKHLTGSTYGLATTAHFAPEDAGKLSGHDSGLEDRLLNSQYYYDRIRKFSVNFYVTLNRKAMPKLPDKCFNSALRHALEVVELDGDSSSTYDHCVISEHLTDDSKNQDASESYTANYDNPLNEPNSLRRLIFSPLNLGEDDGTVFALLNKQSHRFSALHGCVLSPFKSPGRDDVKMGRLSAVFSEISNIFRSLFQVPPLLAASHFDPSPRLPLESDRSVTQFTPLAKLTRRKSGFYLSPALRKANNNWFARDNGNVGDDGDIKLIGFKSDCSSISGTADSPKLSDNVPSPLKCERKLSFRGFGSRSKSKTFVLPFPTSNVKMRWEKKSSVFSREFNPNGNIPSTNIADEYSSTHANPTTIMNSNFDLRDNEGTPSGFYEESGQMNFDDQEMGNNKLGKTGGGCARLTSCAEFLTRSSSSSCRRKSVGAKMISNKLPTTPEDLPLILNSSEPCALYSPKLLSTTRPLTNYSLSDSPSSCTSLLSAPKSIHLVVCVHGLGGSKNDLKSFEMVFKRLLPLSSVDHRYAEEGHLDNAHEALDAPRFEFLMTEQVCPDSTVHTQSLDIEARADHCLSQLLSRLSHASDFRQNGEIFSKNSGYSERPIPFRVPRITRISFVAHSLGCLIVRAMILNSSFEPYLERLQTFLSISGPHTGLTQLLNPVTAGLKFLATVKGPSWKLAAQLTLRDFINPTPILTKNGGYNFVGPDNNHSCYDEDYEGKNALNLKTEPHKVESEENIGIVNHSFDEEFQSLPVFENLRNRDGFVWNGKNKGIPDDDLDNQERFPTRGRGGKLKNEFGAMGNGYENGHVRNGFSRVRPSNGECINNQKTTHFNDPRRNAYLYCLCRDSRKALGHFKHLLLVGSSQDKYAPLKSALLLPLDYAAETGNRVGVKGENEALPNDNCLEEEMIKLVIEPLRRSGTKIVRYEVKFNLPSPFSLNLSSKQNQNAVNIANSRTSALVGRTAHVALIDSEIFLEKLLIVSALKYFHL
ncbi:unnamed protein product [Gordionus sp. m RMFG-2023]